MADLNFENLKFDPINDNSILLDNLSDPDFNLYAENLYAENLQSLETQYFLPEELTNELKSDKPHSFSVLHVNVRSLSKHFDKLKLFLSQINYQFKIICLSETWANDSSITTNSNLQLENYSVIHQIRNNDKRGGGTCCFVHNTLTFKERKDLSINDENNETLCIEINNKNKKNIIVCTTYRPPNGKLKPFKQFFTNLMNKNKKSNKTMYLVGDFNLNILDFETNRKVKSFFNLIFQNGLIPVINKPTRVTNKSVTAIDHVITNSYLTSIIQTGIVKTDISDHFPIYMISKTTDVEINSESTDIFKRKINDETMRYFKNMIENTNWDEVYQIHYANKAYDKFLKIFTKIYDKAFPVCKIRIKTKSLLSPWITKGILNSSKRKHKLYDKFLKHKTYTNEVNYKNYKHLFETIKFKAKKLYYSNLIVKYQNDIKKTWKVINPILGEVLGSRKMGGEANLPPL